MKTTTRTILQLVGLTAFEWAVTLLAQGPDMPGINIPRYGLKWLVVSWFSATLNVSFPFLVIFLPCALFMRFSAKERNYRTAYWLGFGAALVWVVVGNYGLWYANCRDQHTVSYCEGNTYKSN